MSRRTSDYSRGRYGDPLFQAKYEMFREQAENKDIETENELFRAYYLYLCSRKLRILRMAEAGSIDGLKAYTAYAARVILEMTGSLRPGSATHASEAEVNISIGSRYIPVAGNQGFILGTAGRSELNVNAVTGASTAGATPILNIEVLVGLHEWEILTLQPEALLLLMTAYDSAIPLNLDYSIYFGIHHADRLSRLPALKPADYREGPLILGANFALGRTSGEVT